MILLCDTNVFLQTNISSHLALMRFFRETHKFFMGLDKKQVIEQEYLAYGKTNQYLQNVIQRLQIERANRTADGLSGELDFDNRQRLTFFASQYQDTTQIELTMLTIALANPDVVLVCVDSQCRTLSASRRILVPDRIPALRGAFPEIRIKCCDEIVSDLRTIPEGVPRDIASLEIYLDSKGRREHDFLEFKQPIKGLRKGMCKSIAKAVCAMLNSTTGFVMVGIDELPNATIKGFEKTFDDVPKRVDELEIRLCNDYLRKIEPNPDCCFRVWSIDKDPSRIVMIVFVEQGVSNQTYRYHFDEKGLVLFRRQFAASVSSS